MRLSASLDYLTVDGSNISSLSSPSFPRRRYVHVPALPRAIEAILNRYLCLYRHKTPERVITIAASADQNSLPGFKSIIGILRGCCISAALFQGHICSFSAVVTLLCSALLCSGALLCFALLCWPAQASSNSSCLEPTTFKNLNPKNWPSRRTSSPSLPLSPVPTPRLPRPPVHNYHHQAALKWPVNGIRYPGSHSDLQLAIPNTVG